MKPLSMFKEQIRPEGAAAAQAMKRALGRHRLDHVSILVREAVQNSWDARAADSPTAAVDFSARLAVCSASELDALQETVFPQRPKRHPLHEVLKKGLRTLVLEDRGTVGLCGPVFVEKPPLPSDRFINFCRMFGRTAEGPIGGGTYGYGKAVYYSASQASTIIVHSRCREGDRLQERVMALSMWKTNEHDLDTGRYWWGVPSAKHQGVTGPVTGTDATKLAKALGFRPFEDEASGTSIMILAPRFEGRLAEDPGLAARCIGESMVIWFWPRMLGAADGSGTLRFGVQCDGKDVPIPDPRRDAPFSTYATALANLVSRVRQGKEVQPPHIVQQIRSEKPAARLGHLSLALTPRHNRREFAFCQHDDQGEPAIDGHAFTDQVGDDHGDRPSCHHVALIRQPGQVIKYDRHRPFHDPMMEYGGVFLVDGRPDRDERDQEDVNLAFAKAEPASHNDWDPDQLEDEWHKRYVRVAMRSIANQVLAFTDAHRPQSDAGSQDPLGAVSAELGELMAVPGGGATPDLGGGGKGGGPGGGGGAGGRPQLVITDEGTLEELDERPIFVLPFRIEGEIPDKKAFQVLAAPRVLVAGGGTESEPPTGDDRPRIIGWRKPGKRTVTRQALEIEAGDEGDWQVLVGIPGEAMVGVSLSIVDG